MGSIDVNSLSHSLSPSGEGPSSLVKPGRFGTKTTVGVSSKGPVPLAGGGSSSVSVITGFDGLGQALSFQPVPPDGQVAAGPSYLVEMVNSAGEIFTKQGVPVSEFSINSFFKAGPNSPVSDPKVLYDTQSSRWYSTIVVGYSGGFYYGNVTLAVSTSNDPTGTWNLYTLKVSDFLPDQPLLGISDDKVVVSVNDYVATYTLGQAFEGGQYFVLNKSQLVAGASTVDYDSVGPDKTLESAFPVQSLSTTTTQYLVSVGASDIGPSSTKVKLISITGVPPSTVTVTLSSLTITTISNPPNALQAGTSELIQTDDYRIESGVWFSGSLWYTANDACIPSGDTQTRSCIRLTKLATATPSVSQDFDLGTNGQYYYYPALSIDSSGSMDLVYGYSSSTIYPILAITGQSAGAKSGTLAPSVNLIQGTAPDTGGLYYIPSSNVTRYGDFFGASLDPSNSSIVWVEGEYHNSASSPDCWSGNCWSTYLASMTGISGFAVSASPLYLNIPAGSSGTSTIIVKALAGFHSTVSLTASVSRSGPTTSLNPTSVTAPGNSSLTVNVPSNLSGTFTVTVTGTSGSTHSVTINVTVGGTPDFMVSTVLDMTGVAYACGCMLTNGLVTITSVNGFSGSVQLSAIVTPTNVTISFAPSTVFIAPGSRGFSVAFVNAFGPTPSGLYSISITGTAGQTAHSVPVALALSSLADFSANNPSGILFAGYSITTSGYLAIDAPSAGNTITVSGSVVVTSLNATTQAILFNTTYTVVKQVLTGLQGGGFRARLSFNVTAGPYPLDIIGDLELPVGTSNTPGQASDSFTVSRNSDVNENGMVDISDVTYVQSLAGCSIGGQCYDPRADLNADGTIGLSDRLIVNYAYNALDYNKYLYTISASPSSVTVTQGTSQTSTITVGNTIAFAGIVSLSATGPSGLTLSFSTSSVLIPGTSTITVSASSTITPGSYTVTVTGSGGYTTKSTSISVAVAQATADFTLTASPNIVNVPVGGSSTSTITLTSVAGFSGRVTLSVSKSFSGETVSISPSSVTLSSGGSGTATLTVSSSTLGIYTVIVTGTSGNLSHSSKMPVYVYDFIMDVAYTYVEVLSGSPGSADGFFAYSINGAAAVTLSSSVSRSGLTVSYGSNPVNMPSGWIGQTIIGFTSSTPATYTVTLTGTSGILSHQLSITVRVCTRLPCGGGQQSIIPPQTQELADLTTSTPNKPE